MTSDEQYLISKCGKRQPFRVPDGYFDSLMCDAGRHAMSAHNDAMPAQDESHVAEPVRHMSLRWRIVGYVAAACVAAAVVLTSAVALSDDSRSAAPHDIDSNVAQQHNETQPTDVSASAYDDEIAEYSMLDNDQIYSLVASN